MQERTADMPATKTDAKVRGGSEAILLVEDERPVRGLVRNILERYGYRVVEADSAVSAIELWPRHKEEIRLLLTDMFMPDGMTGRELAEKLQAEKPALKVIFTSGYTPDAIGKDFVLREGLNFLQKPYHPRKLAETVRDCLDAE
jgi:CheY-like chemotaxis protein